MFAFSNIISVTISLQICRDIFILEEIDMSEEIKREPNDEIETKVKLVFRFKQSDVSTNEYITDMIEELKSRLDEISDMLPDELSEEKAEEIESAIDDIDSCIDDLESAVEDDE